ncbi:MAG: hypothetical protein P1P84_12750 [Deferrisomatales bacterium]|nr:hypothetical protein [Deferrisomatales bacterium]
MFLAFFHALRLGGVPVSPTEWLTLLQALSMGLHRRRVEDFYYLARSVLVKDVAHYDGFDQAFAHCFRSAALPDDWITKEQILGWLKDPLSPLQLPAEEIARMGRLSLDELLRELEDRLRRQEGPHHGGQHWVGTGGTSPFGAHGSHPNGISFAPEGGGGNAVLQAFERRYRNLRHDRTLDVRQISVALKRLRDLRESGVDEVLDLDATVDKTCRDGGEIDLVFTRERENQVKVLLAMDTGGSMEPFRVLSERLFSAAHGLNHFKDFRAFYFHNCVYDYLYPDAEGGEGVEVEALIRECGKRYSLVVVGDAAMAPFELMVPNGTMERMRSSRVKGIDRLRALSQAFPKRVWLNPVAETAWGHYDTVERVGQLFPMFPLTLAGLKRAVRALL